MNIISKENIHAPVQAHCDRTRRRCSAVTAVLAGVALIGTCQGAGVPGGDASGDAGKVPNKAGYSAGYKFGGQLAKLQAQEPGVELTAVFQGIVDALSGAEPRLSAGEMSAALQSIEQGSEVAKTLPVPRGRFRGYRDDFAALNAKREGVVTLPSGVQYEILQAGTGRPPLAGDAVLVNYQGSLTTGAVFDSTYEDGKPARMQVDEVVVPGLKEALLLMPEGAKWRVVIPPSMGFARSGNNQLRRRDLIYDIELLSVESAEKKAAVTAAETGQPEAASGGTAKPPAASQP